MKKYIVILAVMLLLISGCSAQQKCEECKECEVCTPCENGSDETVDSYTSASRTKVILEGDQKADAVAALQEIDSDLATKAQTEEEGYKAPENEVHVQIMGINPDGTPGVSTIHAWRLDGETLTVVLTDGQNAQNLAKAGAKGTILAHGESYYQLHLETVEVNNLEYTDENYENGLFNSAYSGAPEKLCEYTITFKVLPVEQVNLYVPN